jgi:protein TonB
MPAARTASAIRRRTAISLATSAVCHALLFGLGALALTRPVGRPAVAKTVDMDIVEAKPQPIRDVPPVLPDKQPTLPIAPRRLRTHPKPQARAQTAAPEIAVSPSTAPATPVEVAQPAAAETAPHRQEKVPTLISPSAPAPPIRLVPGPITVLAKPLYRSNPRPDYPIASKRRHEEGEVRLAVTVSPDGRPLRVSLVKSSSHPLLDQAAIDAVRTWTFEPARASGVAVTSEVVVPVRFSLSQE